MIGPRAANDQIQALISSLRDNDRLELGPDAKRRLHQAIALLYAASDTLGTVVLPEGGETPRGPVRDG